MERIRITSLALLLAGSNALAQPPAGDGARPQERLARIQIIERQEGDLAAAERGYRALLADPSLSAAHDEASLALGTLLWQLDRREEARPWLRRASAASPELAARVAALEAQDATLQKLERERVEQAEVLIQRLAELINAAGGDVTGSNLDAVSYIERQLLDLGAATVSAIVARLEPKSSYTNYVDNRLVRLLWQLPSKDAAAFLAREATSNRHGLGPIDAHRLSLAVAASEVAGQLSTAARPSLLEFARCPDPTREILRCVIRALEQQPAEFVLTAFADPHPRVSEAGLKSIGKRWRNAGSESTWRETFAQRHGDRLLEWVAADRAEPATAAMELLASNVAALDGGFSLLLEAVRRTPERAPAWVADLPRDDGARIRSIAEAAAAASFGPFPEEGEPTAAQRLLQQALLRGGAHWDASFVADAIELVELGYARGPGGSGWESSIPGSATTASSRVDTRRFHWLCRAYRLGSDEQRAVILGCVHTVHDPRALLDTASQVPASRRLFEAVVAVSEARADSTREPAMPDSVSLRLSDALVRLAVRSGHPRCAAWLSAHLQQQPAVRGTITDGLVLLSRAGQADARAGLREVLIGGTTSDAPARSVALWELTRVGDPAAIPLLPRALELGLRDVFPENQKPFGPPGSEDGIDESYRRFRAESLRRRTLPWACFEDAVTMNDGRWHGYADPELEAAWTVLLEGTHANASCRHFANYGGNVPAVALPQIAARLEAPEDPSLDRRRFVNVVRAALGRLDPEALDAAPAQQQAVERMLDHSDSDLAASVFAFLHRDTAQRYAERAVSRLRASGSIEWLRVAVQHGVEVPEEAWRAVLAGPNARTALLEIQAEMPLSLRPDLEGLLRHRDDKTRAAACRVLARLYGSDAAQNLLPMLRDRVEWVRNAAREQLQLLREAQEQRRFWAGANGGVDLSPQAVSQQLVQQAMPGGEIEARVLAIRSLAAVGATEALPHLIGWSTEDPDESVRAAAQRALEAILRGSEAKQAR